MAKELKLAESKLEKKCGEEKTLKLPNWMIKVIGESNKEEVKDVTIPSNDIPKKRPLENTENIPKSPRKQHLCNKTIEAKTESHKIAVESDTILESLKSIEGDYKVISLDLDFPSAISSVLSKSSSLHICHGINACFLFSIKNLVALPKVFLSLLHHSKIRLVGKNIVSDLLKIGLDFNLDVQELLDTKIVQSFDQSTLTCRHNWHLNENFNVVHKHPPIAKKLFQFSGKIKYINEFNLCASACEELLFPYFNSLPKTLLLLLRHKNVILTGLNIKNDIRKLSKDFRVDLTSVMNNNLIELNTFANDKLNCWERWSLARLCLHLANEDLNKDLRISDWSKPLTEEQKLYAASDAYASLLCYQILNEK